MVDRVLVVEHGEAGDDERGGGEDDDVDAEEEM